MPSRKSPSLSSARASAGPSAATVPPDADVLRAVFLKATNGIAITDAEGRYKHCNPAFSAMLGYSQRELHRLRTSALIHPDDQKAVASETRRLLAGKSDGFEGEIRYLRKDGQMVWAHRCVSRLPGATGKHARLMVLVSDITEWRRAGESLHQSEEKFRALVQASSDVVYRMSADWKEMRHLVGRDFIADTLEPSQTWLEKYIPPADRKHVMAAITKAIRAKGAFEMEHRVRRLDGSIGWTFSRAIPVLDAKGRIIEWFGMASDVTERRQAMAALRASKAQLQATVDHIVEGVVVFDLAGNLLHWNPAALAMHGFATEAEARRKLVNAAGIFELSTMDGTVLPVEEWPLSRLLRGEIVRDLGIRIRHRAGWQRIFKYSGTLVRDERDEPFLAIVTIADVTERRQAEAMVQEERDRLAALVASMQDEVWFADLQKRFTLANPAALREFGLATGETMDVEKLAAGLEVLRPDGSPRPVEEAPPLRALKGEVINNEQEIIRTPASGELRYRQVNATPVRDNDGKIIGSVSVVRDITGRKRAEAALREAAQQWQATFDGVTDAIFLLDGEQHIMRCNQAAARLLGRPMKELVGRHCWEIVHHGDHAIPECPFRRSLHSHKRETMELAMLDRWFLVTVDPLLDANGKYQGAVHILSDITERKQSEEQLKELNLTLEQRVAERTAALRESEERLRAILNTVADAIITTDGQGTIIGVNPALEQMFGHTKAQLLGGNIAMLFPASHGKEYGRHPGKFGRGWIADFLGTRREAQGLRKDGTVFPIDVAVTKVDHLDLFTGVIRDVTHRKQIESDVLHISEQERAGIAADLHDGVCQELVGINFMAAGLLHDLRRLDPFLAKQLREIVAAISQAADHTRQVARGMDPVIREGDGLMHALRQLAATVSRTHRMQCVFLCPVPVLIPEPRIAFQLYRVAQEAIHNAIRHGQAKRVTLRLVGEAGTIQLQIIDNGCGLPAHVTAGDGMGLRSMSCRIGVIGGKFSIGRRKRGGTEVRCIVPDPTATK